MSAAAPRSPHRLFLVLTFVVAAIVGVAIAYFGISGRLGGPIP